jgi:acyl-CoA hydrolase
MYPDHREQDIHGEFTFVAVDKDKKPISIIL